jgi:ATP dependent DNA ligase-like protein
LLRDPFDREGWLFELKWDGFRAIAETDGQGAVKLYSRNQNDFKKRFPPIAQALAELGRRTILDGEIVMREVSSTYPVTLKLVTSHPFRCKTSKSISRAAIGKPARLGRLEHFNSPYPTIALASGCPN